VHRLGSAASARGAFAGADTIERSLFVAADGDTPFLGEIGTVAIRVDARVRSGTWVLSRNCAIAPRFSGGRQPWNRIRSKHACTPHGSNLTVPSCAGAIAAPPRMTRRASPARRAAGMHSSAGKFHHR
jgi:hypothetical protein